MQIANVYKRFTKLKYKYLEFGTFAMMPNEVYALGCLEYYKTEGLIVDKSNGEFAHCPLPKKLGDHGYYLLPEHHIIQGLIQSKDCDRCCFFSADTLNWLKTTSWFPPNFFELWDLYDEYKGWASKQEEWRIKVGEGVSRYIEDLSPEEKEARFLKTGEGIKRAWDGKTKEEKRRHMEAAVKAAPHPGKPVQVSFPDGEVFRYETMTEAAEGIGVSWMTIRNWAKLGKTPTSGKHKGVSAVFV